MRTPSSMSRAAFLNANADELDARHRVTQLALGAVLFGGKIRYLGCAFLH